MNQKALKTLEYYKIIDTLTEYASTEPGKRLCRELLPSCDYQEILQNQQEPLRRLPVPDGQQDVTGADG